MTSKKAPRKSPWDALRIEDGTHLDWSKFNLLENMLLFCINRFHSVPQESQVRFHLNNVNPDGSLCLLFHIDRESDPLIRGQGQLRPDYVTFYFSRNSIICTIIEIKKSNEKNLEHGIEQITSFRRTLQSHIANQLSGKFHVKYQGILLAAINADIPNRKLEDVHRREGFVIRAVQTLNSADLSELVGAQIAFDAAIKNPSIAGVRPKSAENPIQVFLSTKGMKDRISDDLFSSRFAAPAAAPPGHCGIYVNYLIDNNSYLALHVAEGVCHINFSEKAEPEFIESVRGWLSSRGFPLGSRIILNRMASTERS